MRFTDSGPCARNMAATEAEAAQRSCDQCENPESVTKALKTSGRIKMKESSEGEDASEEDA